MSRFIPDSMTSADEHTRARLMLKLAIGFGGFCLAFAPVLFLISAPVPGLVTLCMSTLITTVPLLLRWTGSLALTCNVLALLIVGLFTSMSVMLGGLHAPTLAFLVIVPIIAAFLIDRMAGFVWSLIVLVIASVLFGFSETGIELPLMAPPRFIPLLRIAAFATILAVCILFLYQYDSSKNYTLDAIKSSNERMITMITHLNATSATLSRSAAEFLGTRPSLVHPGAELLDPRDVNHAGLTQLMLSTANSSRAMIGGVGESIRGMIAQYKHISNRIRELHQQSGTIVELVATIDSISSRLDLMALNTGIEAAHAGEAGKRFKLLADDMRQLAERVLVETRRIKASIYTVQRHTQSAIEASAQGQALTDEGTAKLESMAKAFDDMYHLIERTAEASKRITSDTITQLSTIHDLVNASLVDEQRP